MGDNSFYAPDIKSGWFRIDNSSGIYTDYDRIEVIYDDSSADKKGTPVITSVKTLDATDYVSSYGSTATLNGQISAKLYNSLSDIHFGFDYKLKSSAEWISTEADPAVSFSKKISGLNKNATYTFRAWAYSDKSKTVYGEEKTFSTNGDAVVLVLNFRTEDDSASANPLVDFPMSSTSTVKSGTYYSKEGNYPFVFYATNNFYVNSKKGCQIGKGSNDYIQFPGLDGKRLSIVRIRCGGNNATVTIQDTSGNVVSGGKADASANAENYVKTWTLTGTLDARSYRMVNGDTNNHQYKLIELTYE